MSLRNGVFSHLGRSAMLAATAAIALAAVEPSAAFAGSVSPAASRGNTDISAARRHYRHGGGGAAALAAFGAIAGTIGTIAAAQERRDYYDNGPAYYGGGPVYYNTPSYGYYGNYGAPDPYHYNRYSRGGF